MSKEKDRPGKGEERRQRLAEALRENLKKRRQQQRGRCVPAGRDRAEPPSGKKPAS